MDIDLAVVMPVYNECACIEAVLSAWDEALAALDIEYRILVYNDGSTDRTADVLKRLARPDRIMVTNQSNRGHGPTILAGYRNAVGMARWVFQCDSDGELSASDFHKLWERRSDFDALFGCRTDRVQSMGRAFISAVSRATVRTLFGGGVRDVNTPYRLMRSSVLSDVIERIPDSTFAPNVIISGELVRCGARLDNVPVKYRPRETGQPSIVSFGLWRAAITSLMQTLWWGVRRRKQALLSAGVFLVGLALLPLMVSGDSFWIDECGSARFACARTWREFTLLMRTDLTSDAQMPLFMLLSRLWRGCVGGTEYALRSLNILFGIVSLLAAWRVAVRLRIRAWLVMLLLMFHPFFWAYMNEFRPYAMQIAGGWLLLLSCLMVEDTKCLRGDAALVLYVGASLLAGSSLLGAVPLVAFGLYGGMQFLSGKRKGSVAAWVLFALTVGTVALFGLFYMTKLASGGGGTRVWAPGIKNLVFSAYELLGFSGLGPGRNALRAAAASGEGMGAVFLRRLPLLGALSVSYIVAGFSLVSMRRDSRRQLGYMAAVLALGYSMMFVLAKLCDWPFWGRHLAAFLPCVIVALGLVLNSVSNMQGGRLRELFAVLLVLLLAVSSVQVRFAARFAKDDYRSACEIARPFVQAGKTVWWAAAPSALYYYGIMDAPVGPLPDGVVHVSGMSTEALRGLPAPDLVVLSKPSLLDPDGSIRSTMRQLSDGPDIRRMSFTIWKSSLEK